MFPENKNQIKTFLSVDNTRYKKVLQKKTKTLRKILKTRTVKSDAEYKICKNMIGTIKRKSKRNYYSQR